MPILPTLADTHCAVLTDTAFGERVRHVPRVAGRRDPGREVREFTAVFRSAAESDSTFAGGERGGWSLRVESGESMLFVDASSVAGVRFHERDEVQLLERPGEPWFEVASVDPRGLPRLVVVLRETSQ